MASKKYLSVKLIRSTIGCIPNRRACIKGLGLRKMGKIRILEDTPAIRGMIAKVPDMVEVISPVKAASNSQ